jgi:anti-sigma regulatory factor (Ser/Thr protein kinase)
VSMAVRERVWSMVVPHDRGGARLARQRLAAELHGLVPSALLADAVAVVAELLGNAVIHAAPLPGGVIRLSCRASVADAVPESAKAAWVQLRVTDGGSNRIPVERSAAPDAVDGRGLAIVAALARTWGVDRDPEGQCVWAELGASP